MAWQAHSPGSTAKQDLKLAREELEARGALLKDSAEGLEDLGPTLDCVVWHDGQHYRAALDTSDMYPTDASKGRYTTPLSSSHLGVQHHAMWLHVCLHSGPGAQAWCAAPSALVPAGFGYSVPTAVTASSAPQSGRCLCRLADFHPLTDFDVEHEYGTFSAADACNFGVHFYPQGEGEDQRLVLSIVVDAGSHGTHVAGIATACHPDNPAMNGCAPGEDGGCQQFYLHPGREWVVCLGGYVAPEHPCTDLEQAAKCCQDWPGSARVQRPRHRV